MNGSSQPMIKQGEERMKRTVYVFAAVLLGTMALTTGCASKKRHQRDVVNLQGQISSLQSDVARLDQSLKDTESAIKSAQEKGTTGGAGSSSVLGQFTEGAVYRTPSGFELPAAAIQRALRKAGYYQGEIDGKVGSGTKQAIRNFQRDNGLKTDGICGRQTWARLESFA